MGNKAVLLLVVSGVCLTAGVVGADSLNINFQSNSQGDKVVPEGYFPDYGEVYGKRPSGLFYGWSQNLQGDARDRDSAAAPDQRYDTLIHMQKNSVKKTWEIAIPNGTYEVFLVGGDPDNTDSTNTMNVEGVLLKDPDGRDNFDEYTATVTVMDGRLTIQPGEGASNAKICFVDIRGEALDLGEVLGKASGPDPADGAPAVTASLFTWTSGYGAAAHNIYLGTSPELTEANLVARNLTVLVYYHEAGLEVGAKYYWRVDEIEADMATVHTGDVWSFTAASISATHPSPADGTKWVDPNVELTWTAGKDAFLHEVYLSTDKAAVENADAGALQASINLTKWKPPILAAGQTYFWRVDETIAGGKKTNGAVWSFTTLPAVEIGDPSLLGWWKMDEGAGALVVDWSGHGHHLTFANPAPKWGTGYLGGALEFAGDGDSAVYADGSFLNGLDALTVALWIKSDVTNTDKGYIIFENPAGGDTRNMRYDAAGSVGGGEQVQKMALVVAGAAGNTTLQLESSNNSQTTDWQHVALVWSSGQALQFYVNGGLDVPTSASTAATGTLTGATRLVVGRGAKDASGSWDGLIDETRLYREALTQEEIQFIMRGDPLLAWDPSPANKATTDAVQAVPLTWQPGTEAVQHDVYLGTDEAAVARADASDATGVYRGRQTGTSFTPAPELAWDQKYFWRIDEVDGDGGISPGFVWSFTVADSLILDDFEGYTDEEGTSSRIYETWIDGWAAAVRNGSTVGNWEPPFAEQTVIHGGEQSMPLDYNNIDSPFYSETYRDFTPVRDCTLGGVTDLVVWFRGSPIGLAQTAPDAFTMGAAGADIAGTADEFTYLYKPLSGNATVVAKVESVENTDAWAKAGVMIRQGLEKNAKFAAVFATPGNGVRFQARPLSAGSHTSDSAVATPEQIALRAPVWIKLERTDYEFRGFYSSDGKTWKAMVWNPQNISMVGTVYVGLALTSHAPGNVCTAQFSGVAATGNVSGDWQFAEIGVDHPLNSPAGLYVSLQDSSNNTFTVKHPDPAATTIDTWTAWRIPLSQFTGVNPAEIKRLSIGVGDKDNVQPAGAGRLHIDDIQVVKPEAPAPVSP